MGDINEKAAKVWLQHILECMPVSYHYVYFPETAPERYQRDRDRYLLNEVDTRIKNLISRGLVSTKPKNHNFYGRYWCLDCLDTGFAHNRNAIGRRRYDPCAHLFRSPYFWEYGSIYQRRRIIAYILNQGGLTALFRARVPFMLLGNDVMIGNTNHGHIANFIAHYM